jgi:hypothetical protein
MKSGEPMKPGEPTAPGEPTEQALVPAFVPETHVERALGRDPVMRAGWAWGAPRRGHPEGSVGRHVADLLETIESWGETGRRREELRFLSLVHDSLKYAVSPWLLHIGENHHAMRARRFAERYTSDERLLATIELHDRPFHLWRGKRLLPGISRRRGVDLLVRRVPDLDLFVRFVELDGSTEGKNPEPIRWLEEELVARGLLSGPR